MIDQKNFTIGVLSTTAVVLFAALGVILSQAPTASASGVTANAGQYIVTVGSVAIDNEELLYVTQTGSGKIAIYQFDTGKRQILLVDGLDLTAIGAQGQPAGRRP